MFLIVYFTAHLSGLSNYDIFGTRITTNGAVLDANGLAVSTASNHQLYPAIATDGTDFLSAWHDRRVSTNWSVYAARVQTNGTVLDANGFLIANQAAIAPRIAHRWSPDSLYAVVWQRSSDDVYGAFVTNNATVSSSFLIDGGANFQGTPDVASDGSKFLTVFTSTRLGAPERARARLITP